MPPAPLFDTPLGRESRRLIHGRGGNFPGLEHLAIDWFAPTLVVTFYDKKASDVELLNHLGTTARESSEIKSMVVQRRHLTRAPQQLVYGEIPARPVALESDLHYHLTLDRNQNHGFFLDMKPGRDWVSSRAGGKKILNLFAYTCSLSVAAIAGGAQAVTNLDMAGGALATGRSNHQLNFDRDDCRRASYLAHDLFKSWGKLKRGGPYDLILIDPPSNQPGSFVAEKDYQRIVRRLPELTHPHSEILACLNSPHLDDGFLVDLFDGYRFENRLPPAAGFADMDPQATLKSLVFRP